MILRNVLANYVGQGWSALMALAFVPLYIRHVGIEAYGLIGIYAVLWAWLALLDLGMTPTLNREMARFTAGAHTPRSIRELLRSLELICFGLALVVAAVVWAGSDFIASEWLKPQDLEPEAVAHAIAVMALVIGLRFCEGIYRGSLLGLQRQVWFNVANAALATVRHGGALAVLAWIAPTLEAFFLWQAAASFLTIVVLRASVHRALPPAPARYSQAAVAGVWKFTSGMVGISALALLLTQVDKVLLSRLLPLRDFGYYALAATVAAALLLIVGPITQAVYPRIVEIAVRQEPRALATLYHGAAQLVTVMTAPVMLVLAAFSADVMYVWSGDAELARSVAPLLSTLALGSFLNGVMWLPYHCQLAHGWTSLAMRVNTVAALLLVPAIFWVVPRYGAVGAAWVWVALNSGYVLISIQLMHQRILPGEQWRWYFADLLLPAAGAAGIVLAGQALRPDGAMSRVDGFAFLSVVCAGAVGAAAMLADRVRPRVLARFA